MKTAAEISKQLPPFVMRAGVFVNADEDLVTARHRRVRLEPAAISRRRTAGILHAIRPDEHEGVPHPRRGVAEGNSNYPTDAYLLDAYSPGARGGTGEKFNWDLAVEAQKFGKPVFLAGGLTPENVADAVRKVRPFGVDVSSGVESSPGKKDPAKCGRLFRRCGRREKTNLQPISVLRGFYKMPVL